MRDFFIRGFELILSVVLGLGVVGVILMAALVAFGEAPINGVEAAGPIAGAAILVGGLLYLIVVGGLLYMGLGIYHNTRRMAEALESRGGRA